MGEKSVGFKDLLKRKDVLYIFILGLVVVVAWIGISVYSSLRKTTIPPEVAKQTIPLNPVIDTQILDNLQNRTLYSKEELQSFPLNTTPDEETGRRSSPTPTTNTPAPIPTSSPISTVSGTPTQNP